MSDEAAPQLSQFRGNAEEAFNLYKSVFGGGFSSLVRFKDLPIEGVSIPEEDQDKIMHIALTIGEDDNLMASDALRSLGQELVSVNNAYISVHPREEPIHDHAATEEVCEQIETPPLGGGDFLMKRMSESQTQRDHTLMTPGSMDPYRS